MPPNWHLGNLSLGCYVQPFPLKAFVPHSLHHGDMERNSDDQRTKI